MSILFETDLGDLIIDLYYEKYEQHCKKFFILCKSGAYNNSLIEKIQ